MVTHAWHVGKYKVHNSTRGTSLNTSLQHKDKTPCTECSKISDRAASQQCNSQKHTTQICQETVQFMAAQFATQICQETVQFTTQICREMAQFTTHICKETVQFTTQICQETVQFTTQICQAMAQFTTHICQETVQFKMVSAWAPPSFSDVSPVLPFESVSMFVGLTMTPSHPLIIKDWCTVSLSS